MPGKWEPSPKDTVSLATFRWFANAIENEAMEIYVTDRDSFKEIERVLRTTMKALAELRDKLGVSPDDPCPDGWILCHGMCAPSCDVEA